MWNGVRVDPTEHYGLSSKYWIRLVDDAGMSFVIVLICAACCRFCCCLPLPLLTAATCCCLPLPLLTAAPAPDCRSHS
jgi:hypothetical protein